MSNIIRGPYNEDAFKAIEDFASEKSIKKSLFLGGPQSAGKSHLLNHAFILLTPKENSLLVKNYDLVTRVKGVGYQLKDFIFEVGTLFIDDLDPYFLNEIISRREDKGLRTVVMTQRNVERPISDSISLQMPDLAQRFEIFKIKAKELQFDLSENHFYLMAEKSDNWKTIERNLVLIECFQSIHHRMPDLDELWRLYLR